MAEGDKTPRYLETQCQRILGQATLSRVGTEAWLDIQEPGMLLRFVLTRAELDELIAIAQEVRQQLTEAALAAESGERVEMARGGSG
jgi:hypothetical protein